MERVPVGVLGRLRRGRSHEPLMAIVRNVTRGTVLASTARQAGSARERMLGLIGQPALLEGAALILPGTTWIHTLLMAFPIDVVFYGGSGHVLSVVEALPPWRVSPISWRARGTIELPAGTVRRSGTRAGDLLRVDTLSVPVQASSSPLARPASET